MLNTTDDVIEPSLGVLEWRRLRADQTPPARPDGEQNTLRYTISPHERTERDTRQTLDTYPRLVKTNTLLLTYLGCIALYRQDVTAGQRACLAGLVRPTPHLGEMYCSLERGFHGRMAAATEQ